VSLLDRVGVDPPDAARAKAGAFRSFLLALIAVEAWERSARLGGDAATLVLAAVASLAAGAVWRPGLAVPATAVTAGVVAVDFALQFPGNPNHQYFQLVLLALLLLLREGVDEEVVLLTKALRWLLLVGLFYAGLQKLLYGHYFDGEFLAYTITQNDRFAWVLEPLMPASEFARLRGMAVQQGAGPFRVDSLFFAGVSNLAYGAELVLPVLLLIRRTRALAVAGTLAYFVAIEAAAREVFFGGIMAALALGFGPPSWLQRALPFAFAGLAVLLATSFGLLPRWFFS
jgi:hypothetical protein